jgi:hypothetical protein
LEKFLAGETDAAIAQSLHIQETTVRKHIEEICRQFALDNDKLPGEHRPKRENLLRLFAKYKPELLSQRDVKDIATEEETALKSSSVERHEGAIAEPPPENELDKLVEKARSHSAAVPQPQESAQEETPSKNSDFVGREEAINDLDNLINEGVKVILIQAEGGVGKTTLAQKWFEHQGLEPLLLRVGMTPQNIQSAEGWVRHKLLNDFQENPEQNFLTMLEQLRVKLQTQRIGVLIDNLEPALINGEFIEPHQSYYVELLTVLAHPSVQSITLVTSREPLYEPGIMGIQTFQTYLLEGLKKKAWEKYFDSQNISININSLSEMHRAYGGNALAMHLLSSDIQKQSQGNLKVYWQHNREDLLRHRSLKSLVKRQFNKLREDNRQAYDLLCRLGFYPERDVPSVPNAWLRCLLWDVPEKRRQRVIDDLCDRSLVKVSDEGYYLHPVIRAEAVDRFKLVDESSSDFLRLIKEQIDLLVAQCREIQDALSWISKRFSLVSEGYKKAAFRAFYLGALFEHYLLSNFSSVEENFKYFEIACKLDSRFEKNCGKNAYQEGIETADCISKKIQIKAIKIVKENPEKYFNNVNKAIQEARNELFEELYKFYIINYYKSTEYAKDIADIQFELRICLDDQEKEIISLKKNGQLDIVKRVCIEIFTKAFCSSINKQITKSEFRNMLNGESKDGNTKNISRRIEDYKYNLCPNFSKEQEKLLQQYYEVNLLLVYCLDKASDTVRSHIEDTLLLPIEEIREIERQRGIK